MWLAMNHEYHRLISPSYRKLRSNTRVLARNSVKAQRSGLSSENIIFEEGRSNRLENWFLAVSRVSISGNVRAKLVGLVLEC